MPLVRKLIKWYLIIFPLTLELLVHALSRNQDLIIKYINYPFLWLLTPRSSNSEIYDAIYIILSTIFWLVVFSGIAILSWNLFVHNLWRKHKGEPIGKQDLEKALYLVKEEKAQLVSLGQKIYETYQQMLSDPAKESAYVEALFDGIAHDMALNFDLKAHQYRFVWITPHPNDDKAWVCVRFIENASLSDDESDAIDAALSQENMPDKNMNLKDTWKGISWEACLTFRNSGVFKLGFVIFISKRDKVTDARWESFQELCQAILPIATIDTITSYLLKYNLKGAASNE